MKLIFEDECPWPQQLLPQALPIVEPPPTATRGSREPVVVARPFDPLLNFWGPWRTAMLDWGIPKGGSVDVVTDTKTETTHGWPVYLIDSLIKDVEGKVIEARMTALYFLLEWTCMVAVCAGEAELAANREKAVALLRSGRPEWTGPGIAAISQLYA